METTNLDRIERYVQHKMAPAEAAAFEAELREHPELAEELEDYRLVVAMANARREAILKQQLMEKSRRMLQEQRKTKVIDLPRRRIFRQIAAAAVMVGIVILAYLLFFPPRPTLSAEEIYLQNAVGFPEEVFLSPPPDPLFQTMTEANRFRQNGDYQKALEKVGPLTGVDTFSYQSSALLLQGYCQMQSMQLEEALASFGRILPENDMDWQAARWYTALIYLREDRLDEARPLFEAIAGKDGVYQDRAHKVVNDLKRIKR